jgi:hypothetical protein
LILDLLDKEDTFERQLAVEHVEDKLINKQVSLLDEENLAQSQNGDPTSNFFEEISNPSVDQIYKMIEETSLVNRTRRNFRLLRDWQKKRPW